MSDLISIALDAIERERPQLASWCEDKRHELPDTGKLGALEWICFKLTARTAKSPPERWASTQPTWTPWPPRSARHLARTSRPAQKKGGD